ncbi:MAG: UDP-N-acetylglucosamine diphosphorylase/glucosamine-1-phosphate N-acetyltransferase [Deltaproteobacteria bacterium RBG_16_50_11]|nr:MAG: UDP-N-acetylglucosamine diphosphorylase/glucosamine-1-phosphate N-acetyltransferase [Deltaproteobacteria bacterium RBG_16_50_11]
MEGMAIVILAAGKGTRMNSDLVKVLHPLMGIPMLSYTLDLSLNGIHAEKTVVVVGYQADRIREKFNDPRLQFALQEEQLGTGHAVMQALPFLQDFTGTVLILCGDVPLVKLETLRSFIDAFRRSGSALSVLTTVVENPFGYGRVLRNTGGWLEKIVEEKDASEEEKLIREINTGIFLVRAPYLFQGLKEIGQENAQGEYYLTDLVEVARQKGLRCSAHMVADPMEVMGINTRIDVATAHEVLRKWKMQDLMLSGVTILDPQVTYVDRMVEVGKDTILHPNCILEGKTKIGQRCIIESNAKMIDSIVGNEVIIRSNCVITESKIEDGAVIGPFSHLRPLTEVKAKAKIGNFVEVKKSVIGEGSKANHLSYIGDSLVGEDVNIGAGTITCNYDGFEKHQTIIGDRVFVGSNVELVAPVKIGNRSTVGAGTTVTKNVPEGALAISRMKQRNIRGWDKKMEIRRKKRKKKKAL